MEEGSLRCDANVSVMLKGATEFGTKAEVKNVNSFRYIRSAVEYEIERQIEVARRRRARPARSRASGTHAEGRTYSMRCKEAGPRLPLLPRARPATAHSSAPPGSDSILAQPP